MKEKEIDFDALKRFDMEVISGGNHPEEDRMFSEWLKKRRESADPDSVLTPWEELEAERKATKP